MSLFHKDERKHDREEANRTGRIYTYTPCQCNIGKDHGHFYSKFDYKKADVANRMKLFEAHKAVPTSNAVPPYYFDLPDYVNGGSYE